MTRLVKIISFVAFFLLTYLVIGFSNVYANSIINLNTGQGISLSTYGRMQNKLVKDSSGTLYIGYTRMDGGFAQVFLAHSTDDGLTWIEEKVHADIAQTQDVPALAIDSENNIHVIWDGRGFSSFPSAWNIHYRIRTSNGWLPQELITDTNAGNAFPVIKIDQNDNIHLAWEGRGWGTNTANYDVIYRFISADWQTINTISITDEVLAQRHPSILVDDNNNVHFSWLGPRAGTNNPTFNNIHYAMLMPDNTINVEAITDIAFAHGIPAMVFDNNKNILLVWDGAGTGVSPTHRSIHFKEKINNVWQGTQIIADLAFNQLQPDITIDRMGNTYVYWQGLGFGNNPTIYNIQKRVRDNNGNWLDIESVTDQISTNESAILFKNNDIENGHMAMWSGSSNIYLLRSTDFAWMENPEGGLSILENNITNNTNINLQIVANDNVTPESAIQMRISNDNTFTGSSWEQFQSSKAWVLDNSNGIKNVYVQFQDQVGNLSQIYSDDILLDTIAPVADQSSLNNYQILDNGNILLNLVAQDNLTNVVDMQLSNSQDFANANWIDYVESYELENSNYQSIYIRFRDGAGNISNIYIINFTLTHTGDNVIVSLFLFISLLILLIKKYKYSIINTLYQRYI
jgi:hypothetical protein